MALLISVTHDAKVYFSHFSKKVQSEETFQIEIFEIVEKLEIAEMNFRSDCG